MNQTMAEGASADRSTERLKRERSITEIAMFGQGSEELKPSGGAYGKYAKKKEGSAEADPWVR
ncbi:hypothetical protein [Alicyclobacillus sp. ALC3]|uniref:hypothetical protein n=1 Tax=Alicyclobacillus sp. ALC3 TaxID=2796143 RepID=UPI0023790C39|nr:hypothetical protein [Alicyclobacillus sp. ALC3]WDL98147.1 hypothetical protein JC200_05445 [Alicyclobacillus sp. ALC3]